MSFSESVDTVIIHDVEFEESYSSASTPVRCLMPVLSLSSCG